MAGVGVQLYTLRDEVDKDMEAVLRRVKDLGYQSVEFAGFGNLDANRVKTLLDELGLVAAASHISLDRLQNELDTVIEEQKQIGCRVIVCPYLTEDQRGEYEKLAAFLNQAGAVCQDAGLEMVYHHHDFEFEKMADGRTGMEILMTETSPDLVSFEADVYWLKQSGHGPVKWLKDHKDRIRFVHLKDMTEDGHFAPVGAGTLDIPGIIATLDIDHWLVEQDETEGSAFDSVEASIRYLKEHNLV